MFMVQNIRYSNGLASHMTSPPEYRTPILYSDESGIQVFGIQMVTVDLKQEAEKYKTEDTKLVLVLINNFFDKQCGPK